MLDSRQDLFFSGAATDAGERRPAPAEGFIYLLFFLIFMFRLKVNFFFIYMGGGLSK